MISVPLWPYPGVPVKDHNGATIPPTGVNVTADLYLSYYGALVSKGQLSTSDPLNSGSSPASIFSAGAVQALDSDALLDAFVGPYANAQTQTIQGNFWAWDATSMAALAPPDADGNGVKTPAPGQIGRWLQKLPNTAGSPGKGYRGRYTGINALAAAVLDPVVNDWAVVYDPGDPRFSVVCVYNGVAWKQTRDRGFIYADGILAGAGNAAANLAYLAGLTDTMEQYGTGIRLPVMRTFYISDSWRINVKTSGVGIGIFSDQVANYTALLAGRATCILWNAAPTDPAGIPGIWMGGAGCVVQNVVVATTSGGRMEAAFAVAPVPGGSGVIPLTDNHFKNCLAYRNGTLASGSRMDHGFSLGMAASPWHQQMEDMVFEDCQSFNADQNGFYVNDGQPYRTVFRRCTSVNYITGNPYASGFRLQASSCQATLYDCQAAYHVYGIRTNQSRTVIHNFQSEGCKRVLQAVTGSGQIPSSVVAVGGRWSAANFDATCDGTDILSPTDYHFIRVGGGATVKLIGVTVDGKGDPYDDNFRIALEGLASIDIDGGFYPHADPIDSNSASLLYGRSKTVRNNAKMARPAAAVKELPMVVYTGRENAAMVVRFTDNNTAKVVDAGAGFKPEVAKFLGGDPTNGANYHATQGDYKLRVSFHDASPGAAVASFYQFYDLASERLKTQYTLRLTTPPGAAASGEWVEFLVEVI
ncbi:MAG: right-handed parallel beta-helix repeat-containing protein [Myxococcales bacterium]